MKSIRNKKRFISQTSTHKSNCKSTINLLLNYNILR
nr:MAG TPA: hypothetical protein [Caudoviricetes sp.]